MVEDITGKTSTYEFVNQPLINLFNRRPTAEGHWLNGLIIAQRLMHTSIQPNLTFNETTQPNVTSTYTLGRLAGALRGGPRINISPSLGLKETSPNLRVMTLSQVLGEMRFSHDWSIAIPLTKILPPFRRWFLNHRRHSANQEMYLHLANLAGQKQASAMISEWIWELADLANLSDSWILEQLRTHPAFLQPESNSTRA